MSFSFLTPDLKATYRVLAEARARELAPNDDVLQAHFYDQIMSAVEQLGARPDTVIWSYGGDPSVQALCTVTMHQNDAEHTEKVTITELQVEPRSEYRTVLAACVDKIWRDFGTHIKVHARLHENNHEARAHFDALGAQPDTSARDTDTGWEPLVVASPLVLASD